MIPFLVLNFKEMFWAGVKVRKKDFCLILIEKQQKYRDRAPSNKVLLFKLVCVISSFKLSLSHDNIIAMKNVIYLV